jgi:hypothetical protein
MSADENADWSLVDFASQIAGMPKSVPATNFSFVETAPVSEKNELPLTSTRTGDVIAENPPLISETTAKPSTDLQTVPAPVVNEPAPFRKKQLRTRDEIAKMILDTLRTIDSRAARGYVITVYGSNPWNAMLTIRPEAGPVIDGPLWFSRVQDIGVRFRDDFDVIQDPNPFADGVDREATGVVDAAHRSSGEGEST